MHFPRTNFQERHLSLDTVHRAQGTVFSTELSWAAALYEGRVQKPF